MTAQLPNENRGAVDFAGSIYTYISYDTRTYIVTSVPQI